VTKVSEVPSGLTEVTLTGYVVAEHVSEAVALTVRPVEPVMDTTVPPRFVPEVGLMTTAADAVPATVVARSEASSAAEAAVLTAFFQVVKVLNLL